VKLQQYQEKLQELLEEYGDLDLIYSTDDEGNEFRKLYCIPSLVNYVESDYTIIHDDDLEEYDESEYKKVICVN
jgi:hypothetical protein